MFANELRRAIETAPRVKLGEVSSLMWRAFVDKQITEAEAQELASLIEAHRIVPSPAQASKTSAGSRPRTEESMGRRRVWAASGRLPPALAAKFTQAEVAVLAVVAETVARMGDCRRCIDQISALAGVCRTTVKTALREAEALGLLTIEERRQTAWRNLPNIVQIVSLEWIAWNRLARRSRPWGGGVKSLTCSNTLSSEGGKKRGSRVSKRLPKPQNKGSGEESDASSDAEHGHASPVDKKISLAG